jgi:hypothetical protein
LIERNLKFNFEKWISSVDGRHFVWGLYNSMTIHSRFQRQSFRTAL